MQTTSRLFSGGMRLTRRYMSSQTNGVPSIPSTCPEGTVLKNLNIYKDGKDPVALADSQYPAWLWDLLKPAKVEWSAEEQLSRKYLRRLIKDKIKANALARKSR
ncbi:mitochondrial ribosomal protein L37-domain-containing protein [Phlyctochytrium arcticum]|nr:mitochondrial ribosomal protein L37-domain-containing protein [Phlyctochytrium arcticum]